MDLCYCVPFLTVRVIIQADCTNNVSLRSEATYIYVSRFDNNHYTLIYFDSPNLGLQQLFYIHFHVSVISRHLRNLINEHLHDSTTLPLLEPTVRAGLKRHNARQNSRTSSPTPSPTPTPTPTPTPSRTPGHRRLRRRVRAADAYAYAYAYARQNSRTSPPTRRRRLRAVAYAYAPRQTR
jgi:hypothetical protein